MATSAEAYHQETLKRIAIFSRFVYRHLIDFGLVNLDLLAVKKDVFRIWLGDVGHHLYFLPGPAEIDSALLFFVLIHYFLKLIPDDAGFCCMEVIGSGVHLA